MFVDQRGGEALGNGKSIPMGLKRCKVLQWMSTHWTLDIVQWHSFCHITFIYVYNESHKRCLNHSITHIVVLQRLSLSVQIRYLLRILGLLLNDGQWISYCFNIQWSSRCQYHCWQSHQNRGLNCFIWDFQKGILYATFNFLVYVFGYLLTDKVTGEQKIMTKWWTDRWKGISKKTANKVTF